MTRFKTEAIAGLTTFLSVAYIVIVNPSILSTPGTGIPFSGALTATVLLSFSMTLLMGLYARLPFAVAPGMVLNAFFTFTLVLGKQIPWQTAFGIVFWGGVLFLILSVLSVRTRIVRAIPKNLRHAAAVGIGLFLTFIGLKNAGMVAPDPVTYLKLGVMDLKVALSLLGLLIAIVLLRKKSPFAFLACIGAVTVLAWMAGLVRVPEQALSFPDFTSVLFQLDFLGALKLSLLPALLAICFTDLFDSLSTLVGVSQATGLLDAEEEPRNIKQGLIVDAFATLGGGLLGTSPGTAYIESSAGIEVGGRTGLTAVFTALLFLPCLFVAPLAAMVPSFATAPVLILVGAMMFRSVSSLDFSRWEELIPSFLTIVLIPLTFSITQGILWGFLSHVVLYSAAGRSKEIDPVMYALALASVGLMWVEHT